MSLLAPSESPPPAPLAWKGLGVLLVSWAILEVCSQKISEVSPVTALFVEWLSVFWEASIGLVLFAGLIRPFGWLAAVATFVVYAAAFLIHTLADNPLWFWIGPVSLHAGHGLVLSVVALGIALLCPPARPELTKELRYLLPCGVRDRWLGPS